MLKLLILHYCVINFSTVLANPTARIVNYQNEQHKRWYKFSYMTSDQQERQEFGILIPKGNQLVMTVSGYYAYQIGDHKHKQHYVADEKGYRLTPPNAPAPSGVEIVPYGFPVTRGINSITLMSLAGGGIG